MLRYAGHLVISWGKVHSASSPETATCQLSPADSPVLNAEDKAALSRTSARLVVCALVTNGRAGSDYLQSLFDQDDQVITARIHLFEFDEFLRENRHLATINPAFFAHISLIIFRKSYNPATNNVEGWDTMFDKPVASASSLARYVNALTYLLSIHQDCLTSHALVKYVHKAYSFSLHEDIALARVVLHHAHHWHRLDVFQGEGSELIRVLSCSRNVFDISVSGVLAHDRGHPGQLTGLGGKLARAASDSVEHHRYAPDSDVRTVTLDHLRLNLEYLNSIRQFLNLRSTDRFPVPTVHERVWAGDTSSTSDSKRGNNVRRSRLGRVDNLRISLCSKHRRRFYFGSGGQKKFDFLADFVRFSVLLASFHRLLSSKPSDVANLALDQSIGPCGASVKVASSLFEPSLLTSGIISSTPLFRAFRRGTLILEKSIFGRQLPLIGYSWHRKNGQQEPIAILTALSS